MREEVEEGLNATGLRGGEEAWKRGRVGGGGPLRGPEGVGVEEGLRGGKGRRVSQGNTQIRRISTRGSGSLGIVRMLQSCAKSVVNLMFERRKRGRICARPAARGMLCVHGRTSSS